MSGDNSNDGMQFGWNIHVVVEPELLNRLSRISHAISLDDYILDVAFLGQVLYCCQKVIPEYHFKYFAEQHMHPLGSYTKSLNGVPSELTMRGASIPISKSSQTYTS